MSKVRDFPAVSGSIIWARQVEYFKIIFMVTRNIELREGIAKFHSSSNSFKHSLFFA
jgi:hypothetical protein